MTTVVLFAEQASLQAAPLHEILERAREVLRKKLKTAPAGNILHVKHGGLGFRV